MCKNFTAAFHMFILATSFSSENAKLHYTEDPKIITNKLRKILFNRQPSILRYILSQVFTRPGKYFANNLPN